MENTKETNPKIETEEVKEIEKTDEKEDEEVITLTSNDIFIILCLIFLVLFVISIIYSVNHPFSLAMNLVSYLCILFFAIFAFILKR